MPSDPKTAKTRSRKTALVIQRDGVWLWLFGFSLRVRRNSANREYYSERNRVRCRVAYLGDWRVTVSWPGRIVTNG
jgi:hypothetical protein